MAVASYSNPATGETFTEDDATAAGWTVTHPGVDVETEGVSLNATHWFAEKYVSPPGRPGEFLQKIGHTLEGLLAAIQQHEQQFLAPGEQANVLLPADGVDPASVDTSDESTVKRITDAELTSARQNDVLTVLSDPSDPDSAPEQKVIVGGQEVDHSVLSEPTPASTQAAQETREAHQAAIAKAIQDRDAADKPSDANSPDASLAALGAETSFRQAQFDGANAVGDPGDSGNDPELVQPEASEATDASDSEQQSQVPDSEAASSDAGSTNSTDSFPKENESQPELFGPDTDAEAPAPAPNAE